MLTILSKELGGPLSTLQKFQRRRSHYSNHLSNVSTSHIPFLFRILSVEYVFPLKEVPNLIVASVYLVTISGITYKNPNVPNIDAVAPWDLQADLGRPIHARLHIFVMRDIPRHS